MMEDTNVESPKGSSIAVIPLGNSLLPSVRGAVLPSTQTDDEFFKNSEKKLLVLFVLFKSLLENTCSGDVVQLSIYGAMDMLRPMMDEEEARALALEMISAAKRRPNPMDCMF